MKIGILTFHPQLNYGAILQAYALQTVVRKICSDNGLKCEVTVVDRWFDAKNTALFGSPLTILCLVRQWLRWLLGLGDFSVQMRRWRTIWFHKKHLTLTGDHFVEWDEFNHKCSLRSVMPDLLIVGSDQVWNFSEHCDPRVYLLDKAPSVRAIAYAASFGMVDLPVRKLLPYPWELKSEATDQEMTDMTVVDFYKANLRKFLAISCREQEGVDICNKIDVRAEHVVDPTLLAAPQMWMSIVKCDKSKCAQGRKRHLCCYFIGEDTSSWWSNLLAFANENNCCVDVFTNVPPAMWYAPMPRDGRTIKLWATTILRRIFSQVKIRVSSGPLEFIKAIANADWVVSDSFHALMFSIIFKKNVRILRPHSAVRKKMFGRIQEFAAHCSGNLIADNMVVALESFTNSEPISFDEAWIDSRRKESNDWLADKILAAMV